MQNSSITSPVSLRSSSTCDSSPDLSRIKDGSSSVVKGNLVGQSGKQWEVKFGSEKPSTNFEEARQVARDRLETVAKQRGDGWSIFPRVLGGLSLGVVALTVGVAGGVVAVAGAVIGTAASMPVALGAALLGEKGAFLRTLKTGMGSGTEAGMKLARLPLEVLGYALKAPGALLGALYKAFNPSDATKLGRALLKDMPPGSVLNTLGQEKTHQLFASKPASMSADELKQQILVGEQLVTAIMSQDNDSTMQSVTVKDPDGQEIMLKPNNEMVNAIVWYLTAKSVETTGESYHRGTFNMVDPGHKLMRFMANAPTCHGRISTHFASRSLSPSNFTARVTQDGLLSAASKSPVQYGIEDFGITGSLPNGMHAILFDAMMSQDSKTGEAVPQTMIKLETFGMPTANRLLGHSDSSLDILGKMGNAILSLSHCAQHGLNFITSRFEGNVHGGTFRESATKDLPGQLIYKPLAHALKIVQDKKMAAQQNEMLQNQTLMAEKSLTRLVKELKEKGIDDFYEATTRVSPAERAALQSVVGVNLDDMVRDAKREINDKRGHAVYNGKEVHIRQGGEVIIQNLGLPPKEKQD